ncbi:MAG TPA: lipopolysaccharide biosynthesis protein RfbH [Acidimicrobiales bacterium]|nr:lipopolysaccharide biosynthesis protein RfbH [Acidimicrobiales bacterium]
MTDRSKELRSRIIELVREFHTEEWPERAFVPGVSPVPVSGRVFDADEVATLVECSLDFWLTTGRFATEFEARFTEYLGVRHAVLCNSGSSANLLAVAALTSERLGDRRLCPGDEVITVATGFPTTVNPMVQHGLKPVFVDIELGTYNALPERVAEAIGPRSKAIMMAHTLGNPFALDQIAALAEEHGLWLIEDNCDALGSTFGGQMTGTFGDLATVSFYPAHQLTMGEGGAVLMPKGTTRKLVESFRDWGRDCWCETGMENTCGRRFDWQLGDLPHGYDHKYIYSHIGYNLKLTDMQAAVGVAQMDKLPGFVETRRRNWEHLRAATADLEEHFVLPFATAGSEPSWFGYCLSVRPGAPFTRHQLVQFLESRKIGTRQLFGGNLTRQPAYEQVDFRVAGDLSNADFVAEHTFWLGVYPGLTPPMVEYMAESLHEFVGMAGKKDGAQG